MTLGHENCQTHWDARSPSRLTAKTLKWVHALESNNPCARKCTSDWGVLYAKGIHHNVIFNDHDLNVHVTELLSEL